MFQRVLNSFAYFYPGSQKIWYQWSHSVGAQDFLINTVNIFSFGSWYLNIWLLDFDTLKFIIQVSTIKTYVVSFVLASGGHLNFLSVSWGWWGWSLLNTLSFVPFWQIIWLYIPKYFMDTQFLVLVLSKNVNHCILRSYF